MKRKSRSYRLNALSPENTSGTFTLDVWTSGNPVGTDAAPNSSAPPANRVLQVNPYAKGAVQFLGLGFIRTICIGGTSITYTPWIYDNTLGLWVQYGPSTTITVATTNTTTHTVGAMLGAKFFMQITAVNNAGSNVTNFGYSYL